MAVDLSSEPPPMWDLFGVLLAAVAVNAVLGMLVALASLFRRGISDLELRAWGASALLGGGLGAALTGWPAPGGDAYFVALLWMLLLAALALAGAVLCVNQLPDRRVLGGVLYRSSVVASGAWIAAMVGLQAWGGH